MLPSIAGSITFASVAQLDRASDSDSEGRGFESRQMHHEIAPFEIVQAAFCFTFAYNKMTRAAHSAELLGRFYSAYFSRLSQSISSSEI